MEKCGSIFPLFCMFAHRAGICRRLVNTIGEYGLTPASPNGAGFFIGDPTETMIELTFVHIP